MRLFRVLRPFRLLVFVCLVSLPLCAAEPGDPHPVINTYIVRTAERLDSPHRFTYHLVEWSQQRGRWILPDIGYWDTGYGQDQLWFAGGGATVLSKGRFHWDQEVYFAQEAGPAAHNQRCLWIWPVLDATMPHRLHAQLVAYPTIPLNDAQRWGMDVDRFKLEREGTHWKYGAGYAGGKCGDDPWHSKPFATVTRKSRLGSLEMWLQRIPGGAQAQVRYQLSTGPQ